MNTDIMKNNKFTTHEHESFVCPHRIFMNDINYYRPRQKYLDNFKDILIFGKFYDTCNNDNFNSSKI